MSQTNAATTVCVDPDALHDRLDEVTVIDVRTPGEFETVHIPSADNLPLDRLDHHADRLRALVQAEAEVVLVCRSGNRAHQAQDALVEQGLPRLPILEGGMLAWQAGDGPVVQDVIRWDLERQVRLTAGLIVLASILLSIVWPPARFVAGALGVGLIIAAVTNTCAMGMLLSKLPYNRPTTA
ncbi:MAG: rhodanese-like domain-containing protein [Nitriliruptoraceae bacterium]